MYTTEEVPQAPVDPNACYSIEFDFNNSVSACVQAAFEAGRQRWCAIVVSGGDPMNDGTGAMIQGVRITVTCGDFAGEVALGADTTLDLLRPDGDSCPHLPAKATIRLNAAAMTRLCQNQDPQSVEHRILLDLATHEIGHALGFSKVVWDMLGIDAEHDDDEHENKPWFTGTKARDKYNEILPLDPKTDVPLEDRPGPVANPDEYTSHWAEWVFNSELMTHLVDAKVNPIGPVTVAALKDMGYQVNDVPETPTIDINGDAMFIGDVAKRPNAYAEVAGLTLPSRLMCRVTA
jgi:hypothetical protein